MSSGEVIVPIENSYELDTINYAGRKAIILGKKKGEKISFDDLSFLKTNQPIYSIHDNNGFHVTSNKDEFSDLLDDRIGESKIREYEGLNAIIKDNAYYFYESMEIGGSDFSYDLNVLNVEIKKDANEANKSSSIDDILRNLFPEKYAIYDQEGVDVNTLAKHESPSKSYSSKISFTQNKDSIELFIGVRNSTSDDWYANLNAVVNRDGICEITYESIALNQINGMLEEYGYEKNIPRGKKKYQAFLNAKERALREKKSFYDAIENTFVEFIDESVREYVSSFISEIHKYADIKSFDY